MATEKTYQPIACGIYDQLEDLATRKVFCRIHYKDDIHAYHRTTALIKDFETRNKEEYMLLSTGEEVRLDRLVKINDLLMPGHSADDFTCDC